MSRVPSFFERGGRAMKSLAKRVPQENAFFSVPCDIAQLLCCSLSAWVFVVKSFQVILS